MKAKKSTRKAKAKPKTHKRIKPKPRKRIKPTTFTIGDIRSWQPCYDPMKYLPKNWEGTVLDILDHDKIPFHDKLWVICREELLSEKLMRLFAVYCARQVQHLMKDERSIKAIDVAERFALGQATREELTAACVAAWTAGAAYWDARWAAYWDARWAAYWAAYGDARWAARAAYGTNKAEAQQKKLREMIIKGLKTGDTK